ncbi:hypothetical protein [Tunturiibacter gelidiferens]|uniref:hypothetical protein n=1 Tax=Tunturiibacter gelidiferens TaxID=3069689 RepID=UPI003D9B2814
MAYDYAKAAQLKAKAERLLRAHRQQVFTSSGEYHVRAIARIKSLMAPLWKADHSYHHGLRLERMGY